MQNYRRRLDKAVAKNQTLNNMLMCVQHLRKTTERTIQKVNYVFMFRYRILKSIEFIIHGFCLINKDVWYHECSFVE